MRKLSLVYLLIGLLVSTSAIAQEKVVVVPLGSTKISKLQTLTYNKYALIFTNGESAANYNGCITNQTNANTGKIHLSLPVGSEIISIKAAIYDDIDSTSYSIILFKNNIQFGNVSLFDTTVASTIGGSESNVIVQKDLTPTSTEIVDEWESFYLIFYQGATLTNGFCGAQVTIKLP